MLYYGLGNAIIDQDELATRRDELHGALSDIRAGDSRARIELSTGQIDSRTALTAFEPPEGGPVPLQPIGMGRPLSVRITEIYTGRYSSGIFGGTKDMLVTSAAKSIAAFDAKPRAMNFLTRQVEKKARVSRPSASSQGTPYAYYSPALLERSLTLDLTMVFDTFPNDTFEAVSKAFTAAAGLPLFLSKSVYLLGAGALVKLLGTAGEALFDGSPSFDQSIALDIELPGSFPLSSGFLIVTDTDLDREEPLFRKEFCINAFGQVVSVKGGTPYRGDLPYFVVLVDGTKLDELQNFSPTAASAALLDRFFGAKSGQEVLADSLIDALRLYNDVKYRRQVESIDEKLKNMKEGPDKEALKKTREALLANILQDFLKPG